MRRGHYMSLSFLDILIGFLGSILFMFIVVDKGSPIIDIPTPHKELTKVHAYLDNEGNLIHNLNYPADIALELGTPYLLILDSNQEMEIEECPPCLEDEDNNEIVPCPNPAHHKQKLCPNPNAHTKNKPIACNKTHCDDKDCESKVIVKEKIIEKIIIDPISIPYELGFAVYDINSINRDIDIQVCPTDDSGCVNGFRKRSGELRWIDLNKSPIWESDRQVTGGEFVIAQTLVPGRYKVSAKYDVRRNSNQPLETEIRAVVSTKQNGRLESNSKRITLQANQSWEDVMEITVSSNGGINTVQE